MKFRILFVTGDRAEYDLLFPLAKILRDSEHYDIHFAVCGTHLVNNFGNTLKNIQDDEFVISAKIDNLLHSDHPNSRGKSLGIELLGITDTLRNLEPDLVIVLGDREEALATAIACNYARIVCAHIGGGDACIDGNTDNSVRDATSKLSHVHFTTTEKSRNRLLSMGEDDWRCFVVGSTGVDRIRTTDVLSKVELSKRLGLSNLDGGEYAVLIYHPIISDESNNEIGLQNIISCLKSRGIVTFFGRPNSDPGNSNLRMIYKNLCSEDQLFIEFKNLPRLEFVNLLRHARFMIGNSSSGIIEAPFIKLPVINVGARQKGREHTVNTIFTSSSKSDIDKAISKTLEDKLFHTEVSNLISPYGDGFAAQKILKKINYIKKNYPNFLNKIQQVVE